MNESRCEHETDNGLITGGPHTTRSIYKGHRIQHGPFTKGDHLQQGSSYIKRVHIQVIQRGPFTRGGHIQRGQFTKGVHIQRGPFTKVVHIQRGPFIRGVHIQ